MRRRGNVCSRSSHSVLSFINNFQNWNAKTGSSARSDEKMRYFPVCGEDINSEAVHDLMVLKASLSLDRCDLLKGWSSDATLARTKAATDLRLSLTSFSSRACFIISST